MTYAREIAHRLHPVQMAACDCDGGETRPPSGWCAKATAIVGEVIERCAQEAERGLCKVACFHSECVGGKASVADIRALAATPALHPATPKLSTNDALIRELRFDSPDLDTTLAILRGVDAFLSRQPAAAQPAPVAPLLGQEGGR